MKNKLKYFALTVLCFLSHSTNAMDREMDRVLSVRLISGDTINLPEVRITDEQASRLQYGDHAARADTFANLLAGYYRRVPERYKFAGTVVEDGRLVVECVKELGAEFEYNGTISDKHDLFFRLAHPEPVGEVCICLNSMTIEPERGYYTLQELLRTIDKVRARVFPYLAGEPQERMDLVSFDRNLANLLGVSLFEGASFSHQLSSFGNGDDKLYLQIQKHIQPGVV